MNRKFFVPLVISTVLLIMPTAAYSIAWYIDKEAAEEEVSKRQKPLMMMVYSEDSEPYRKMQRETFTDSKVYSLLEEEFVCLKLDDDEARMFVEGDFGVEDMPAFVFYDSKGKPVKRAGGYYSPSDFMQILEDALSKCR